MKKEGMVNSMICFRNSFNAFEKDMSLLRNNIWNKIATLLIVGLVPSIGDGAEAWKQERRELKKALSHLDNFDSFRNSIRSSRSALQFQDVVNNAVLLTVSINPEARVKINTDAEKLFLRLNETQYFLVAVNNAAGITATLNLTAFNLAANPPTPTGWCEISIVNSRSFTSRLLGYGRQYMLLSITSSSAGLAEIRIVGDAGQGTQDLGFRATADILINTTEREFGRD